MIPLSWGGELLAASRARHSQHPMSEVILEVESLILHCCMLVMIFTKSLFFSPVRQSISDIHNKCLGAEHAAICDTRSCCTPNYVLRPPLTWWLPVSLPYRCLSKTSLLALPSPLSHGLKLSDLRPVRAILHCFRYARSMANSLIVFVLATTP